MDAIRLSIAASRPGAVLGRSSGQADCRALTVLPVASFNSFRSVCCDSVGCTVCEICSIGQFVRAGACSPQTTDVIVELPARVAPGRNHVRVTSPLIRIGTEDAYVDIIKGVRPERII